MKLEGKGKEKSLPKGSYLGWLLTPTAFIITGGCGSIGGSTARAILAKGGIAVVGCYLPGSMV